MTMVAMLRRSFVSFGRRQCLSCNRRLLSVVTPGDAGTRAEELAKTSSNSTSSSSSSMDTLLAHAGVREVSASHYRNKPLSPPLDFATTYTRPAQGPYQTGDAIYSRLDNPTRVLLEETVFDLECNLTQQDDATESMGMTCAFASGMMAASSIVLAHALPLTVVLPHDLYHGVSSVLIDVFQERFGVQVRRVDSRDLQLLEKELAQLVQQQTSGSILLWMESPSNPQTHILDFQAVSKVVEQIKRNNHHVTITTVVDSTLAPPVIQQPLLFGVDVVMHSGTKYIAGHSDALLGITTASPFTEQGRKLGPLIRQVQGTVGGVASPMDSWLALRGLRTLHVRVERQCQTALTLAKHLSSSSSSSSKDAGSLIRQVHYPGLTTHPGHAIAQRQMKEGCYGGVLSVEFHSEHMAMAFAGALRTMFRGTSLGGTETLIEERRSIEPEGRQTSPPGLLRISVGLEDAQDLIRDVEVALSIAKQVQEEMI